MNTETSRTTTIHDKLDEIDSLITSLHSMLHERLPRVRDAIVANEPAPTGSPEASTDDATPRTVMDRVSNIKRSLADISVELDRQIGTLSRNVGE